MKGYVVLYVKAGDMLAAAHELEGWALEWLDKHPEDDFALDVGTNPANPEHGLIEWERLKPKEPEGG